VRDAIHVIVSRNSMLEGNMVLLSLIVFRLVGKRFF